MLYKKLLEKVLLRKTIMIFNFLILIILSSFIVNGFGVTLPYNPVNGYGELTFEPGQTRDVIFMLQNYVGDKDITIKVSVKEGSNLAGIVNKDEILVPKKTKDIEVPVRISIPKEAKVGDKYLVILYFRQLLSKAGGTSLGTGIEQRFYVDIQDLPEQEEKVQERNKFIGATVLLILIIIIVLVFLVNKFLRKNNKNIRKYKK